VQNVRFCTVCGQELKDTDQFCWKCGARVIHEAAGHFEPRRREGPTYNILTIAGITVLALLVASIVIGSVVLTGVIPTLSSANVTTRDMTVTDFTNLNINDGFQVQITQGASYNITVTANSNIISRIQVIKSQNTVTIGLTPNPSFMSLGSTLKAEITMPDLQGLTISGGSNAHVSGFVLSHDLTITLSGGSTLRMDGKANDLTAVCTGGSDLELSSLNINNASIDFSGGSRGTINLNGRLDATLSGGSNLYYIGNPTLGTIETSGGAQISRSG